MSKFAKIIALTLIMKTGSILYLVASGLFLFTNSAFCQNTSDEILMKQIPSYKAHRPLIMWNESKDLTWDDFTPQHGLEGKTRSNISIYLCPEYHDQKIRNTYYYWYEYQVAVNPDKSIYDPESATGWELRYNNVLFDIAELSAREVLGHPQLGENEDENPFWELLDARLKAIELESDYGKDTAVITAYEKEVEEGLARNQRQELFPDLSSYRCDRSTFATFIGYDNSRIIGTGADIFEPFNGFSFGLGWSYRNFKLDAGVGFLWSRTLKSGLYHDIKQNYDWVENRKTQKINPSLTIGYALYSNDYITVHPVIGISSSYYSQDWKDEDDATNSSSITSSPCWIIGLETDWMTYIDANNSNVLRFKIHGVHEKNDVFGDVWSLNIGVSLVLGINLKSKYHK